MVEVARDGSGHFTTIQAAIDAAPEGGAEATIIHVAAGTYVEKLTVPATKGPIVLVGDGRDATSIEFDQTVVLPGSGQRVATRLLTNRANDLVIRALTLWNRAGEPGGSGGIWDAAVENYGDRLILDDVHLRADHDTLLMYGRAYWGGPGPSRVYVHDSHIQGRGDFIASFSSVFIERSVLETLRDRSQFLWQQGVGGLPPEAQDALVVRDSVFTGQSLDPLWPAGVTNLYLDARVSLIGNVFEFDLGANRPVVYFNDLSYSTRAHVQHFGNTQSRSTLSPLIWELFSVPGGTPRIDVPVTNNEFGEPIIESMTEADATALVPLAHFGDWDPRTSEARLACEDGVDNDEDGLVDADDPGCLRADDVWEGDRPDLHLCADGFDNDADGLVDLADPGCLVGNRDAERTPLLVCDNGLDDDGDGLVDGRDTGCDGPDDPSEQEPRVACDNGVDDDGDGLVDLADSDCSGPSDATERFVLASSGCGIGPELLALAPLLEALRRRARRIVVSAEGIEPST